MISERPRAVAAAQTGELAAAVPARRRDRGRVALMGWGLPLVLFAAVATVGPTVVPYDPVTVQLPDRLKPPGTALASGAYAWLGTDQVGKDLLAQILQGAQISLLVGTSTVLAAGLLGLAAGLISGYYGGWADTLLMRLADIQLAFPSLLLAILLAAVLGPSITNVVLTLSITRWVVFARAARATTLTTREREFVLAARACGADAPRLLRHAIAPFALTPLIVVATVELGLVILAEASLSFLGLGTPPDHPSWGLIIANGRNYVTSAWWISTLPGIALSLLVIAIGLFGDQLRDQLDPRTANG